MERQRIEYIRDKTQAYTLAKLQEFNSMILHLAEQRISAKEFHEFIKTEKTNLLEGRTPQQEHWMRIAPACPKCGARFDLVAVIIKKGPANKKGYKSRWICSNNKCVYEEYSTRPYIDLFKERERLYNKSKTL